jgi:hypothetical protein
VKINWILRVTDTANFDHITGDMIDKIYNFDPNECVFTPEN